MALGVHPAITDIRRFAFDSGPAYVVLILQGLISMARKRKRHRLLQTKAARHRRKLYAIRAKEKSILRKRITHQKITFQEYEFLKSRRKAQKKRGINRQKASKKTVRAYIQITFVERIKNGKKKRATIRKQKQGRIYRADIDRGNVKVRTYSEYLRVTQADIEGGNLSHKFRARVERYQSKFNATKNFKTMNASVQLFAGRILNPYNGLLGRPASVTPHARMRSVKRRAGTQDLDEVEFQFQLTEFEDMIDYMEDLGFVNYSSEGDSE